MISLKATMNKIPGGNRRICTLFDGVQLAKNIKNQVKQNIIDCQRVKEQFKPKLVAIAVGNNPASDIYLRRKLDSNQPNIKANSEVVINNMNIEQMNALWHQLMQ